MNNIFVSQLVLPARGPLPINERAKNTGTSLVIAIIIGVNKCHFGFTDLRFMNLKTVINATKEFQPQIIQNIKDTNVLSNKAKNISFSPRSLNVDINEKPLMGKIKEDPVKYIPIINPRSILPLLDTNWRSDEIGLPAVQQEEKQAIRLIVIRRKKMKKHQRRKLWKRMRHRWARVS